ncbi:serine/threonine protein kinase, partial [Nocardiopsis nanhaiensis]
MYLVMNYVEGLDLRDWRAENAVQGPRGQREVLRYLEQVAQVLDMLHSGRATPSKRVVVHGDLSPGNIMISEEGQATLVDFGLSRIAARHMTVRPWFTPGYAAPEIFNGEYSPATDRYAFGAIAFFSLTGEDPPPAPEQLRERMAGLPLLMAAGDRQREIVMSMFSADPSERPETSEWVRALRSLATSVPWTGPTADPGGPTGPGEPGGTAGALAGGALAGGALAAAAAVSPEDTDPDPASEPASEAVSGSAPGSPDADTVADGTRLGEDSAEPEVTGPDAPPQGKRFSGPAPESGPAVDPDADSASDPGVEDMYKRPVGGMRGSPSSQAPEPLEQPDPRERTEPRPQSGPPSAPPTTPAGGPSAPGSAPYPGGAPGPGQPPGGAPPHGPGGQPPRP